MYKIYHSARFDKEISKFDINFNNQMDKIEKHLKENPYVGDPIDSKWLREKRVGKYRSDYLIYEELKSVFMVAISEKKDQQKVIDTIQIFLSFFKEEIEKLIDEDFT